MCCGGSTAQGRCGVRQAQREVAGVPRGTVWHFGEATGAQGSLPQDGCGCAWLKGESLCAPRGFGNLKQPCLQPRQRWQGAGSP